MFLFYSIQLLFSFCKFCIVFRTWNFLVQLVIQLKNSLKENWFTVKINNQYHFSPISPKLVLCKRHKGGLWQIQTLPWQRWFLPHCSPAWCVQWEDTNLGSRILECEKPLWYFLTSHPLSHKLCDWNDIFHIGSHDNHKKRKTVLGRPVCSIQERYSISIQFHQSPQSLFLMDK